MKSVILLQKTGRYAENKDIARDIRVQMLLPALEQGEEIVVDFNGVDAATQSFIHALISEAIRRFGADALEKIIFRGCNENVRQMIKIVADYVQEGLGEE